MTVKTIYEDKAIKVQSLFGEQGIALCTNKTRHMVGVDGPNFIKPITFFPGARFALSDDDEGRAALNAIIAGNFIVEA